MSKILPENSSDGASVQFQHNEQNSESSTPLDTSVSPTNWGDNAGLFIRLRAQVEFYFSPQNLSRDIYLRNMLTAKHQEVPSSPPLKLMAPIGVITNFPKVRDICASFGRTLPDPPLVLLYRACEGSTVVTISMDGAWIGPTSQRLPPLSVPPPRVGLSQPQSLYQQGYFPSSPHPNQHYQTIVTLPGTVMNDIQSPQYVGAQLVNAQNAPLSQDSGSHSSNSLESMHSNSKEGNVFVVVTDIAMEYNPIQLMTAFSTDTVQPKSVSVDRNNNSWYVSFVSEVDAKTALISSRERTIAGVPIRAYLKSEPSSPKVSVTSASGASLSSMSEGQRPTLSFLPAAGPQTTNYPIPTYTGAALHPIHTAYPLPQPPTLPPLIPPAVAPYPIVPQYNLAPMQVTAMPGQPFPSYYNSHIMQQMYPYYVQQHGQPFPLHQSPMGARFGPGIPPPPPPRYPGPDNLYQHGIVHHNVGDMSGQFHGHPSWQQVVDRRGSIGQSSNDGGQKKTEHGNKKKKNAKNKKECYVKHDSNEGGNRQRPIRENSSSPNIFARQGKDRSKHIDNFKRSGRSSSPAFDGMQKISNKSLSKSNNGVDDSEYDGNKEIFSAEDFPGLGVDRKPSEISQEDGHISKKTETKKLIGYADALLKKGVRGKDTEPSVINNSTKEAESKVDISTVHVEAIEKEIINELHDLSVTSDQNQDDRLVDKDDIQNSGAQSNDGQIPTEIRKSDDRPVSPLQSVIGQGSSGDMHVKLSDNVASQHYSNGTETEAIDQPSTNKGVTLTSDQISSPPPNHIHEKRKPHGAWGTRRLFSDVIKDKD